MALRILTVPHNPFKPIEIIADSHGERQQFLETLVRFFELDGNAATLHAHTRREVCEFLIDDAGWGLDEQLRLFQPFLAQFIDQLGHFTAALNFVEALSVVSDALETGNEGLAVGYSVGANPVSDAGCEDLLGATPPDAEQKLDSGPVYIRNGMTA
jgi:hypothetical protein